MSSANAEIVRQLYAAFNARDLDRAVEMADPEIEWIPDPRSILTPVKGREDLRAFLADQIEMVDPQIDVEELFDQGDDVVAFIRVRTRGLASGAAADVRIAAIWTFRGRIPIRFRGYAQREQALADAGLS